MEKWGHNHGYYLHSTLSMKQVLFTGTLQIGAINIPILQGLDSMKKQER